MARKTFCLWAIAMVAGGCKTQPPPSAQATLSPAAEQKARADLQESISNYVRTAPKKGDFRAVLDPRMEVVQGDPGDPVPSNLGLLEPATGSQPSGLDAYSPIIVKAVQARLRESLGRDPTTNEVVDEITTAESKQGSDIVAELQNRQSEITSRYAEIATLNQQGNENEVRKRLNHLRLLREGISAAWYQQQGVPVGKTDTSAEARSPAQIVTDDRNLLRGYLNGAVFDSP